MPGLVGFYGDSHHDQPRQLLQNMAQALEHESLFRSELHQEGTVGVGRVTLGIANAAPQPHWNEAETVCVFLEGELYGTNELRQDLAGRGCQFRATHDAELVLRLYETFDEEFAADLNGNFLIAIWNRRQQKLIVANDRLGQYPLYFAQSNGRSGNGRILFASGVRALLADPELSRDVDRAAIAEFLTFDHVLGDRTLLTAARLLPQASLLILQNGEMTIRPYYTLRYPETYPLRSEQDYVDELQHLMQQAITRQAESDQPVGVLLSGGLDSRQILAVLNDLPDRVPLHSFTWGLPSCDDARYAQEIAAMTRAQHHFFPLQPDFLLRTAENSVRITDGMGNIVNLHALATLDEETQYAKIIYKGFLGDAMFGFALRHQFWADYDDETRIRAHLQVHHDQGVVTFDPFMEHEQIFTPDFRATVGNTVMAEYHAGMEASGVHPLATQRLYFDLTQRVPRMTLNGVEVARSRAMVRLPFADNDLVEFSTRVPLGLMYGRSLPRQAFVDAYPKMSQVPLTDTGLPMMACLRDMKIRMNGIVRWWLHNRGIGPNPDTLRKPYKDYHNWFRTNLRSWVEDILLSQRHLQRGYYNPQAVRQVVADHMAGKNQTVRLGALIAIELWHRQFIDRD